MVYPPRANRPVEIEPRLEAIVAALQVTEQHLRS
jgi:hypothetical protein